MDTNFSYTDITPLIDGLDILVGGLLLLLLIGYLLKRFWLSKKDKYIEVYNKDGKGEGGGEEEKEEGEDDNINERFYFISCEDLPKEWNFFDIIVDKQTRVQYLQDTEGYSLTPLIDSEGKPILYDGEFEE